MPRVRPLIKQDPRKTAILQEIGGIMAALHLTQNEWQIGLVLLHQR